MAKPYSSRLLVAALLIVALQPIRAADDAAKPKGDLWQVTTKMSMEGMPMQMPSQTMKVCSTKEMTRPPTNPNDQMKCQETNYKKTGSKVTWESVCKGPPAMTGVGEINFEGTDSYTGSIKYSGDEGGMTIEHSGKKLGSCDNPT